MECYEGCLSSANCLENPSEYILFFYIVNKMPILLIKLSCYQSLSCVI